LEQAAATIAADTAEQQGVPVPEEAVPAEASETEAEPAKDTDTA
jgi:hypothetical protein